MKSLTDTLGYIDGHHESLKKQSCPIPEPFTRFTGYNTPELSKHRKRTVQNLSSSSLQAMSTSLFHTLQASYWKRPLWQGFHSEVESLVTNIADYAEYLVAQNKTMKTLHARETPVRQISDALCVKYVHPCSGPLPGRFVKLNDALIAKDPHQYLFLNDYVPDDSRKRYEYLQTLERTGVKVPVVVLTQSAGNNLGYLHFIWRSTSTEKVEETFQRSLPVIEAIKPHLPVFHTRTMRRAMFEKFGRVAPTVKSAVLQYFYRDLTGDSSASHDLDEAEIDKRVQEIIEMEPEDPTTIIDLREVKHAQAKTKFDVFWAEAEKYLNENVETAVDDRRHAQITHLAKAISVRDFRQQVQSRCPEGAPIPSEEWLRLQFWPKTPKAKVSLHYTGRLKVRFMIQQRQFRKSHEDQHYAAAVFRYLREYAVKLREICTLVCLDDKHRLKVGEPGFLVAAAERGRRVLVRVGSSFEVGDHDFTKYSLIPSVSLIVDIPEDICGSWYSGQVLVGLKEAAFEPSSPMRHAAELGNILSRDPGKSVLFVYSDGGPDHRLTYVSVQLALISVFLKLDLDYLCAARTAPSHSWRNPVERIMSTLNLGLQSVGLMREQMDSEFEAQSGKCSSLKDLRDVASRYPDFQSSALDSVSHVKVLLLKLFERLDLKGKKFEGFCPASSSDIDELWAQLQETVDSTITPDVSMTKAVAKRKPDLTRFIEHCCVRRHYFFVVKKCGSTVCTTCNPPRLPPEVFSTLHSLPDPVPGEDGHYKPFGDVFGTKTNESHRPSLQKKAQRRKTLPFTASVQHVKNIDLMLQCDECGL